MTVLRVFDRHANIREAAEHDYEMAKQEVIDVCKSGSMIDPCHQARFRAAMERQEKARERYMDVLGA